MSRKIIETFWSWYNSGIDRTEIRALIECDNLTDLPSQDALSGYRLTIGTTAHVIDTNAVYMMQSGGSWKVQSAGTDVYTKAETDALIASSIKSDVFAAGDHIDVTAVSKGKGFQGTIKRLGQHRGPMKHGSKFHRHAGSNGTSSDPSRVYKGKGMPGQMGNKRVTIQNLEIVRVDAENNLILVKGAVPGPKKGLVNVKATVKNKK
jgi:50S ribosomal protein uL3